VELDGQLLVTNTWEPAFDTARALLAKGITGAVTFYDHQTQKPRCTITNIEQAAKQTISENRHRGPTLVKWSPYPTRNS